MNISRILKQLIIPISLVFGFHQILAQNNPNLLQQFVDNNITKINTVNINSSDNNDLTCIKNAIGNAKIVMLGEQDHGDAPTFLAKSRIIKYLHEEMGFDVIAFESGFYGLNRSWDLLKPNSNLNAVYDNIFKIWTKCEQTQPIFNYIKSAYTSNNPLIVTGFDCQDHNSYARNNLQQEIDSILKKSLIPFTKTDDYPHFISILPKITSPNPNDLKKTPKKERKFFFSSIDTIINQFSKLKNLKQSFWLQALKNIKGEANNLLIKHDNSLTADNIRDTQMADNMLWIIRNKYPNKKIILWLHSQHEAKNMNIVLENVKEKIITIGRILNDSLQDKLYALAFTSYTGTTGRISQKASSSNKYKVQIPDEESIETFIHNKKFNYAFINFKNAKNNIGKFKMKGVSHYGIKTTWDKVFDGLFYIQDMYPCNKCCE